MNVGRCTHDGHSLTVALVHDPKLAGFVRVYVVDEDEETIADLRRGVAVYVLPAALTCLGVEPDAVEWGGRCHIGSDGGKFAECLYEVCAPAGAEASGI